MKVNKIIRSVLVAELILLAPLIAMFFTEEVDWDVADFIVASILLAGIGLAYQLIVTGLKNNSRRAIIGAVLAAAMLLIWVELAVGLFGSPFAGS